MPGQDFPRDYIGRPQIIPRPPQELVDAGDRDALIEWASKQKRNSYTRATTFVGAIEDTYHLGQWQKRMVLEGIGKREDLYLAAFSHAGDKKELDRIAEQAMEAAGAGASATKGTAIHLLTEKVDAGEPLGPVPSSYKADLDAYRGAIEAEGLGIVAIEKRLVQDELRVAGTADRLFMIPATGQIVIGDVKTGSRIDLGIGKIAQQLAMYAHSEGYDLETGERSPLDVDQSLGVVIHLPVGTGTASVHWLDLDLGWKGVQLSGRVREFRKNKMKDFERKAA